MSKASEWARNYEKAELNCTDLKADRPWFGLRIHRFSVTDEGTLKVDFNEGAKVFSSQEVIELARWILDMFEEKP